MEILCTDSRCPDMTLFSQRIHEMNQLSIDDYTKLAFTSMCHWFPQFDQGIESSKFIKMVRECKIFPDIKKPARLSQIDFLFQAEAKGENGLVEKYVTYTGFCKLVQELAIIRFPPELKAKPLAPGVGAGEGDAGDAAGESLARSDQEADQLDAGGSLHSEGMSLSAMNDSLSFESSHIQNSNSNSHIHSHHDKKEEKGASHGKLRTRSPNKLCNYMTTY